MLLLSIQTFIALLVTMWLRSDYLGPQSSLPEDKKLKLFEFFGTFTRALCSLCELCLANYAPICRFLLETLHEVFWVPVVLYRLVMGFAVLGVINAVFISETFKVANTNDQIMMRTKKRAMEVHRRKMKYLFAHVTNKGTEKLTREEFKKALKNMDLQAWLASMDLEPRDADLLFDLLNIGDDDSTQLSVTELIEGVSHLRGPARAIDMRALMWKLEEIFGPELWKPTLHSQDPTDSSEGGPDEW
jgi:hypothetical protein